MSRSEDNPALESESSLSQAQYNLVMLMLLQAAAQLPPVYVTVQQPAGGMPEWAKILISAATGAILGIISNIAMEYLKPWITKRQLRKLVERHLAAELFPNLDRVNGALETFKSIDLNNERDVKGAFVVAKAIINGMNHDRYDYYMTSQKAVVYEVDAKTSLSSFYSSIPIIHERSQEERAGPLIRTLKTTVDSGTAYVDEHGLHYMPRPFAIQQGYASIRAERKVRERS